MTCSLHLLSMATLGAGWTAPQPPHSWHSLWASMGSQTSWKQTGNKTTKEKLTFNLTSELVKLNPMVMKQRVLRQGWLKSFVWLSSRLTWTSSHLSCSIADKFHACHTMFLVISLGTVSVGADIAAVLTCIHLVMYRNPFLHPQSSDSCLRDALGYDSAPIFLHILWHNSFVPFFRGKRICQFFKLSLFFLPLKILWPHWLS